MDGDLTPLLRSLENGMEGRLWRQKAPKKHTSSNSSALVVVKPTLDPVRVCSVDGVARVAFSETHLKSQSARTRLSSEILELDEERIGMMFDLFHEAHILSACVVLSKEMFAGDVDVAFVSVLVDRVSRSFQDENQAKSFQGGGCHPSPNSRTRKELETITNMLAKLTADDNQMSLTIVNCLRQSAHDSSSSRIRERPCLAESRQPPLIRRRFRLRPRD